MKSRIWAAVALLALCCASAQADDLNHAITQPAAAPHRLLRMHNDLGAYFRGHFQHLVQSPTFYGYDWLDDHRIFIAYYPEHTDSKSEWPVTMEVIDLEQSRHYPLGNIDESEEPRFDVNPRTREIVFNDDEGIKAMTIDLEHLSDPRRSHHVRLVWPWYGGIAGHFPFWIDDTTIGYLSDSDDNFRIASTGPHAPWSFLLSRYKPLAVSNSRIDGENVTLAIDLRNSEDSDDDSGAPHASCVAQPEAHLTHGRIVLSVNRVQCSDSESTRLVARLPRPPAGDYPVVYDDSVAGFPVIGALHMEKMPQAAPGIGPFDKVAAGRSYADWYKRFLANMRTLAQEAQAGKAPGQSRVNEIFADSLIPDSRMVIFLTELGRNPDAFRSTRYDPPTLDWISIMMDLLEHAVPAGQGGPYTQGAMLPDMLPTDRGSFLWYMTLKHDSSITSIIEEGKIFPSYYLPPNGVFIPHVYPFIAFRKEHGKLYCTSISREFAQVVSALYQMQLY